MGQVDARQIEGHWYWNTQKQNPITLHSIGDIRMGSARSLQVPSAVDTRPIMTEKSKHLSGSGYWMLSGLKAVRLHGVLRFQHEFSYRIQIPLSLLLFRNNRDLWGRQELQFLIRNCD